MRHNVERVEKTLQYLRHYRILDKEPIGGLVFRAADYKKGSELPSVDESWQALGEHQVLSGYDAHFWLYTRVKVPPRMRGKALSLQLSVGEGWDATLPQVLVYIEGELPHTFDVNHAEILLDGAKTEFDLYLYAYTGVHRPTYFSASHEPCLFAPRLSLVEVDKVADGLYFDLSVPFEVLKLTDPQSREYARLLLPLANAVNLIDLREPRSAAYRASLAAAADFMATEFYGKACERGLPQAACVGHTHIDIAWLWTVAQTREKAQRSFATVVDLLRRYPDYKFMSSQPILYKMVKEEAPALYEELRRYVREGRWEVEGAMWVEADCNLISGESLVRQILHGKRFMREEFGVESKVLWLPDVFGYSAALPQILKKSGVEYFVTSKISWNDTNAVPYDIFSWRGIDGSEVFTYFLTAQRKKQDAAPDNRTTYNALGDPAHVMGAWHRLGQKELSDEVLLSVGYGDGGGGTTPAHIEQIGRMAKGLPGCPTAKFDTVMGFLAPLRERCLENRYFPRWEGELYLEYHRGTYTSQAKNKKNNRKSELALADAELFSVMGRELFGKAYPKAALRDLWECVLTNQFHDIIPGSSIHEVYEVCDREYAALLEEANSIKQGVFDTVAADIAAPAGVVVFNGNAQKTSSVARVGGKCYYFADVPAKGYKYFPMPAETASRVRAEGRVLENDFYRLTFDDTYALCSIWDKRAAREIVPKGKRANLLRTYEDIPMKYDNWELRRGYREKHWDMDDVERVTVVEDGARKGVRIARHYLSSRVEQTVWLYDDVARVDFDTEIDWQNEHIMLKALFPLDLNTAKATCDIQFGTVERNTHQNTTWDVARFEFPAHKYVDVSEGGFGVALLNDCKYGYSVLDDTLGLTLLKSGTEPDPMADKGKHRFTYALCSHSGALADSDVVQQAFDLNRPLQAVLTAGNEKGKLPGCFSLVSADCDNIIVDTVKQSEEGEHTVIRLYETANRQSDVTLTVGIDFGEAVLCDLMEHEIAKIPADGAKIKLTVKPFEIITLMLKGKRSRYAN